MKWTTFVTGLIFALTTPVLAQDRWATLVQHWLAQIGQIQPIVVETTTTYTYGKLVAVCKARRILTDYNYSGGTSVFRYDNEMPIDLVNDPLQDNMNPVPDAGQSLKIFPGTNYTQYMGKEIVDGVAYDVVQVNELFTQHFIPPIHMFDASLRKSDNTLAIKWYFDAQGIVRRMTFTADPPTSATQPTDVRDSAHETVLHAKLTVTMVVDSLRKPRSAAPRPALSDPLFVTPVTRPGNVQGFAYSPDGSLLAIGGQNGLQMIRTDSGKPAYAPNNTGPTPMVDFSLDGRFVACATYTGFSVLRTADGMVTKTVVSAKDYLDSIRMSADGRYVVTTDEGPDVKIWNVETGLLERTLPDNGRAYEAMFTPDGKRLVTIGYNSDILIWDTKSWQVVQRLPMRAVTFQPFAISPDGKIMAMLNADNTIQLWDGVSGKPIKTLSAAATGHIWFLGFSNDSQMLYCTDRGDGGDMPTRVPGYTAWNIASGMVTAEYVAGSPAERFMRPAHGVISPDGRFAAFRNGSLTSNTISVFALPSKK